jgi:hypothetical protein
MAGDHIIRASDRDRDAAVGTLREAYAAGRLTLDEFQERTATAYESKTWGELRSLTADLPEKLELGADVPGRADPATAQVPAARRPPQAEFPMNAARPGPSRRRTGPSPILPFVVIWFFIVVASRSTASVVAPIVVVALLLLFTAMSRRR